MREENAGEYEWDLDCLRFRFFREKLEEFEGLVLRAEALPAKRIKVNNHHRIFRSVAHVPNSLAQISLEISAVDYAVQVK